MTGNICRCSNYNRYVAATLAAAAGTTGNPKIIIIDNAAGENVQPLKTWVARPLALTPPTRDRQSHLYQRRQRAGMLYARVLRSPHPHARMSRLMFPGRWPCLE